MKWNGAQQAALKTGGLSQQGIQAQQAGTVTKKPTIEIMAFDGKALSFAVK